MSILVTGGNGFLGLPLLQHLSSDVCHACVGTVRRQEMKILAPCKFVRIGDMGPDTDWSEALQGIGVVIHTAGRVHVMREMVGNSLEEFRRVNVKGTIRLARQAAERGARRFIFISSIKVNGESTDRDSSTQFFRPDDPVRPVGPYAQSKWEAEQALQDISDQTGMELVIIRPALVYGPGVKGNFLRLLGWLSRGIPLPLGSIDNRRSLIALGNLVDLIVKCIDHPNAANRLFLAADGEDLSTPDLLMRLGRRFGRAYLIPISPAMLRIGATVLGQQEVVHRLMESLQVDISETRSLLRWTPPLTVDAGLAEVADWYISQRREA